MTPVLGLCATHVLLRSDLQAADIYNSVGEIRYSLVHITPSLILGIHFTGVHLKLMLYEPVNSYCFVGTLPPFYGTSSQHGTQNVF